MASHWQKAGDEKYTNIPGILSGREFTETLSPWWQSGVSGTDIKNIMTYLFKDGFAPNIWQMYDYSDSRVVSGNYLKIQSISLRYQLPRKLLQQHRMKSGYLMFTGTNLYTFAIRGSKDRTRPPRAALRSPCRSVRPTRLRSMSHSKVQPL